MIGSGAMVVFGAAVYINAKNYSNDTSFHSKDPDPSLRRVEKDILIPKIMRDRSRQYACAAQVKAFNDCCLQYKPGTLKSYFTFINCKNENDAMMQCMNEKFLSMDYYYECKEIYLHEKKLFQKTDVLKKDRTCVKDYIENSKPVDFEMTETVKKYFENVSTNYKKTNNINSFDESLLKD